MMTAVIVAVVAFVAGVAWSHAARRRREREYAARLYRIARKMDERAARATLHPRTGNVVASVQVSPNGHP